MVKDYHYDLIGATKAGSINHPQIEMEKLGLRVVRYAGVPIADCVIMRVENAEDAGNLPDYITALEKPYFYFEER